MPSIDEHLTLKNIGSVVGLITVLFAAAGAYFAFKYTTQAQLDRHQEQILSIVQTQTKTAENHTTAIRGLTEKIIRLEEREKMRNE